MRTSRALGFSFSLHLLMAALLAAVRGGIAISPNVVMVEWIENAPSVGTDAITAAPSQRQSAKPISASKTEPAVPESGLAPKAIPSLPSAGEYSPEAQARRMTLEESYLASVRQTLERNKIYPPLAKRLGQTGRVTLKFKVAKDGALLGAELLTLSPFPVLNEAAKNLLASAKFQPIPDELNRPNWEITIPVEYRLD